MCPTLCNPMNSSMPGFPVLHYLPELANTHFHWVSDAIKPSYPLSSPFPALNLSQHQSFFPNELALCIKRPKYWSFSTSPSNESFFRNNYFDLLAIQGTPLSLSQHQGPFQWVGSSHQVAKYWSFSISPSSEYSSLISCRIDWFDLLAVQGTLKSLLQHHSLKTSVLWHSAFFMVQLSYPYMTTEKNITLTTGTFIGKVMPLPLLFNMPFRFVIAFLPKSVLCCCCCCCCSC